MSNRNQHTEWLSLIERSGAFISLPILEKVYPQGLETFNKQVFERVRDGYNEWRDAVDEVSSEIIEIHQAWIDLILNEALEFEETDLVKIERDNKKNYCLNNPENEEEFNPSYLLKSFHSY